MHIFQHLLARRKLNAEKPLKLEMLKAPWNEMWKKKKKKSALWGKKRLFPNSFWTCTGTSHGEIVTVHGVQIQHGNTGWLSSVVETLHHSVKIIT